MAVANAKESTVIRFGVFEVDPRSGELRRSGSRVRLPEQSLQILLTLLERRGDVVAREELQKRLWPADTFVDFDHSLNVAVRRLREALDDSADNPRFVETVARRGYRFIAPVNSGATAVDSVRIHAAADLRRKWVWPAASMLVLVAIVAGIAWQRGALSSRSLQPVERRLTANPEEVRVTAAAISRDGKFLAFSDKNGCYVRNIDSGETHSIPLPPWFNAQPASWFPDGIHLLVTRVAGAQEPASLWTVSIMGEPPRKVADQGRWPAVSPDGTQIVFAESSFMAWPVPEGSRALWIMESNGEKPRKLVEERGAGFGTSFGPPAWSLDGKRIAFVRNKHYAGFFANDNSQLEILDLPSGKIEVALRVNITPGATIGSPVLGTVAWSDKDNLIYSADEATPSAPGDSNLWKISVSRSSTRLATPVRLTRGFGHVGSVSVAVNQNRLAFVRETRQADVYVSDLQDGGRGLSTPRRVTLDERDDYPSAWTADSKSILFSSNRDGIFHIFKQAPDHSDAELLVGGNEQVYLPRLSPDGSHLLYFVAPETSGRERRVRLMRMPIAGGPPQVVVEAEKMSNFRCARAPAISCILDEVDHGHARFFLFDPLVGVVHGIPQVTIEHLAEPNLWDLSPDGRTLATAAEASTPATASVDIPAIKLTSLEDFSTRTLLVPGWIALTGLDWAADGNSLWVGAHSATNTYAILNIDLKNHVTSMLQEDKKVLVVAIPSPDGRRVALWEKSSGSSNVWMLENF